MKMRIVIIALLAGVFSFTACNSQNKKKDKNMESQIDSVSYSIGISIGKNLKNQGFETLNEAQLAAAIKDVYEENEFKIPLEETGAIVQAYIESAKAKKGEANVKKGQDFLAENAKKKGVVVTESGLQYEVITEGDGSKPTAAQKVSVHYHGTLIDGEVFDSSVERGQPAQFGVSQVIKGWTEALQLMAVGSKWKLVIPAELAYGDRGAGQNIGPGTTLIFEVELLSIVE